jgi:hypothetical protein
LQLLDEARFASGLAMRERLPIDVNVSRCVSSTGFPSVGQRLLPLTVASSGTDGSLTRRQFSAKGPGLPIADDDQADIPAHRA